MLSPNLAIHLLSVRDAYRGSRVQYGGREGHSRHVAATSQRRRDIALRRRCDGSDGAAMALARRSDVAAMALPRRSDGAAMALARRSDVAAMALPRRSDGAAMALGRRSDIGTMALQRRSDVQYAHMHANKDVYRPRLARNEDCDNEITWDHFMESYPWTRQCMFVNVLLYHQLVG